MPYTVVMVAKEPALLGLSQHSEQLIRTNTISALFGVHKMFKQEGEMHMYPPRKADFVSANKGA